MSNEPKGMELEELPATVAAIREGFESFARGEGLPAREALEQLSAKLGLKFPADSGDDRRISPK